MQICDCGWLVSSAPTKAVGPSIYWLWGYRNRTLHRIVYADGVSLLKERTTMIKPMIALATATALLVSSAAPSFANGGWHGGGGWHHHGGGLGVGPAIGLG